MVLRGKTTGIGFAIARCLAANGSRVVISGRDAMRGEQAVNALRSQGADAAFVRTDVAHDDQVTALAVTAAGDGTVDIRFNFKGVHSGIVDTPMADRLTGRAGPEAREQFAARFAPSGKLTSPEDVGKVVADLVSCTGGYPTGTVLLIDAGPSVEILEA